VFGRGQLDPRETGRPAESDHIGPTASAPCANPLSRVPVPDAAPVPEPSWLERGS